MISAWINPYNEKCGTLKVPDSYNARIMDGYHVQAQDGSNNTNTYSYHHHQQQQSQQQHHHHHHHQQQQQQHHQQKYSHQNHHLHRHHSNNSNNSYTTLNYAASDAGFVSPPPSPRSNSSLASCSSSSYSSASSSSAVSSAASTSSGLSSAGSENGSSYENLDNSAQRLAVLSFEQVKKLNDVMNEPVAIHGRGNFPTLEVKLTDLVNIVREKLEADIGSGGAGMIVKDIRLNGGAASHVLASEAQPYNDLDLIFAVEFSSNRHFDRVKSAVLSSLLDLLPEGVVRRRITQCSLKEAYVGKMVKVNNNNDGDRWSLISLGNSPGHKNVELKFVDTMRRQFEFSVDSFQIVLDSLLLFYDCTERPMITENFYPSVVGESVYGDFQEALYHLQKKLISTRQPEEIRGGGLLKYCNLLVRNYIPVDQQKIKTLERYMCSRFFIDFPDIDQQKIKLESYLRNHFWGEVEEHLQYQYLMHLYDVVEQSTVCLMGHERRQTLMLIESLAMQVLYRDHPQNPQTTIITTTSTVPQHTTMSLQPLQTQLSQMSLQPQQLSPVQQTVIHHHHPQGVPQTQTLQLQHPQAIMQQQSPQPGQAQPQQQTISLAPQPAGLLYANGIYYAPVIPTTLCTCNATWLTT